MRRFFAISVLVLLTATLGAWAQGETPETPNATQQPLEPPALAQPTERPRPAPTAEPDPDAYIPDAVEPTFDYEEFQKRLVYPAQAKEDGVEGRVAIRVLVDTNGIPGQYRVDYSDAEILADAVIEAIMAMRFTPGNQAGKPVRLWVSVPVVFQLGD